VKPALALGLALLTACTQAAAPVATTASGPNVKLSGASICHLRNTPGYQRTRDFRPFETMEACLKAGGRMPMNQRAPATSTGAASDKALFDTDDESIVKKSLNGICHDANSGSFDDTIHFRAYRSMRDCLDSGGKMPGK
jgi:hypothetical protein